jgi:uncharacterized protein YndB with AHSA1/START domain
MRTTLRGAAGTLARVTTTRHDAFTVESKVIATPALVFAAFSEPRRRRRWIRMPGSGAVYDEDFRVGGFDVARSTFRLPEGEQRLLNTAVYLAIQPGRRIVWSYTAAVDDVDRWASLVTVELEPVDDGTLLRWTEQVSFLVASERPDDDLLHLRGAIRLRLNGLAAALED